MLPRLGERPLTSTNGAVGYTVAQTARLLGCSESTARRYVTPDLEANGVVLCAAHEVEAERAVRLMRLGAIEPGETEGGIPPDVRRLQSRIIELEERLRLIGAARAAARDRIRSELAEEQAYLDMSMLDVAPPR